MEDFRAKFILYHLYNSIAPLTIQLWSLKFHYSALVAQYLFYQSSSTQLKPPIHYYLILDSQELTNYHRSPTSAVIKQDVYSSAIRYFHGDRCMYLFIFYQVLTTNDTLSFQACLHTAGRTLHALPQDRIIVELLQMRLQPHLFKQALQKSSKFFRQCLQRNHHRNLVRYLHRSSSSMLLLT